MTERVIKGFGVSHGIAMGHAFLVQIEAPKTPGYKVEDVEEETTRLEAAINQVRAEIEVFKKKSGEEIGLLMDSHLAMLSGRLPRSAMKRIRETRLNAERAVEEEAIIIADQFRALKDPYIAARCDDVLAVGWRIIRVLMNVPYLSLADVPQGGIVLAREISPADTTLLDPRKFSGIATAQGGIAGHTAVMARGMGLPAVLGLGEALLDRDIHGAYVIVDGVEGKVIVNPSLTTRAAYIVKQQSLAFDRRHLHAEANLPAVMKDKTRITLNANLETPRDLADIHAAGADGIGLFRTEFMFMNRDTLPTEDEQYEAIAHIVREMKGKTVTFRTLDIGGDKMAKALGGYITEEANPSLGLRAIRLSLRVPDLLRTQFRAILRAGAEGPVRILLPMVTIPEEVVEARRILEECHAELKGDVPDEIPPLGTMIEIPAAALSADALAAVSDFFALGTNDLIQYTTAIDRGNDKVAQLYNPLNPAVLRLMEFSVAAGVRAQIPVSICGEMAADPKVTALLIGFGIREISSGFASLPRVKHRIRALTLEQCEGHAQQVMDQYDAAEIARIVEEFNA